MRISSGILAQLIEPTLFALRRPSQEILPGLVERATKILSEQAAVFERSAAAVDKPSYEFGVATTFAELLSTAEQRSEFGDAIKAVRSLDWAQTLLHEIALIERHGIPIRQQSLAQQLGMDGGNLSRRIQKLILLNLVERRAAGADGSHFYLSALGRDVLDDLVPGWQANDPGSQECFPNDEVAATAVSAILERHHSELIGVRMRAAPALIKNVYKGVQYTAIKQSDQLLIFYAGASAEVRKPPAKPSGFWNEEVQTVGRDHAVNKEVHEDAYA